MSNTSRLRSVVNLAAALLVAAVAAVSLSACNTIAGAGQDLSSAGHDVTGGADAGQKGIHSATGAATN